jgi:UDP-N-acetyl-D-mannosaminuronate dehydrogenase
MTLIEIKKSKLIDRIIATRNEKLLEAISDLFDSTLDDEIISLTPDQAEMLWMSEQDIEGGKLVSEADLDKSDSEWLR